MGDTSPWWQVNFSLPNWKLLFLRIWVPSVFIYFTPRSGGILIENNQEYIQTQARFFKNWHGLLTREFKKGDTVIPRLIDSVELEIPDMGGLGGTATQTPEYPLVQRAVDQATILKLDAARRNKRHPMSHRRPWIRLPDLQPLAQRPIKVPEMSKWKKMSCILWFRVDQVDDASADLKFGM